MGEIASRQLRNEMRSVLTRVEAGEPVVITVDGRPVAELRPVSSRVRWAPRESLAGALLHQADAAMSDDLTDLSPDSTDDVALA
jgi:prevent-host-death family protein